MFKISHLRLIIAGFLLLSAIVMSAAQETITLSKATEVIKISNPMGIIDEYAPIFKEIDRIIEKADTTKKLPADIESSLRKKLNDIAINLCVDIRGDFYIAMYMDTDRSPCYTVSMLFTNPVIAHIPSFFFAWFT